MNTKVSRIYPGQLLKLKNPQVANDLRVQFLDGSTSVANLNLLTQTNPFMYGTSKTGAVSQNISTELPPPSARYQTEILLLFPAVPDIKLVCC